MTCWNILGLTPDADSRAIKRQYAALLKKTRPDDDPEGFQRLREAYEQALRWSQEQRETVEVVIEHVGETAEVVIEHVGEAVEVVTEHVEETLEQRYQAAMANGTALFFEIHLLHRCVDGELSAEDARWAFQAFNWLTAWQRLELPVELIDTLERQHRAALQQPLRLALEQKDEAAFLAAYAARDEHPWVHNHPHGEWFNEWLAKLLAQSHFWSSAVFDAVCAGQGWHGGADHNCPASDWTLLLKRQQGPAFLARQRALAAEPPYSPQQRAARLLLAPMSLGQRRAFAQRLNEDDWKACQSLSADIYADHVVVAEAMPGGTVYFWQDWDKAMDTWPWVVALVVSCLVGVLEKAEFLAGNVVPTLGHGLLWSLAFVVGAGLAWQGWRPLAHHYRVQDEAFSQRLPGWLSPTHLPLLPVRDLVPGLVLVATLGYIFGPLASVTLIAALALIGGIKRPSMSRHTPWTASHPRWTLLGAALGVVGVIALYAGLVLLDNGHRVVRNQGLQQWTERLCSRMPRSDAECQAPATQKQWYGQEAAQ
ncbi:J domain-containing protein [Pseudomonas sp. B6002]|uniref:J domain-containing protein n=1 Tax=Pseudomonas sp. B6002 TaxID=2726978 RepID=UPI0015A15965|nr:J domain-containing protein [Pseudomonas sp. B6002]NVZ50814.1 J domain-containing protein [Pseudomonas sp. B6002]